MPPFPGAVKTLSTLGLWDNFQDNTCSRPPEPITKTLTNDVKLSVCYIFEDLIKYLDHYGQEVLNPNWFVGVNPSHARSEDTVLTVVS